MTAIGNGLQVHPFILEGIDRDVDVVGSRHRAVLIEEARSRDVEIASGCQEGRRRVLIDRALIHFSDVVPDVPLIRTVAAAVGDSAIHALLSEGQHVLAVAD